MYNINYYYANGNRTYSSGIHYSCQYNYNTMVNIVDIDLFQGLYLGNLNKNLIQSKQLMFTMASDSYSNVYQYELNSIGLVIRRIETTTYNRNRSTPKKRVSAFEYIKE